MNSLNLRLHKNHLLAIALSILLLCAILLTLFLLNNKSSLIDTNKAAVNPIYWGAYIDYGSGAAPFNTSAWDKFETDAGKKVSILHWGQAWKDGSGNYQNFPTAQMSSVRNRGAIPMIDWGSWIAGAGSNQPNFKLTTITSGTYDAYIKQWATDAKNWGQPFFLRLDHEMNIGGQFPWNISDGVNTATDYINMWRHVHDIFAQVGATNVTWVWCPNIYYISGSLAKPFMQVYPGDNYVDWTALDGYNGGSNWDSFSAVFSDSYKVLTGQVSGITGAPTKPIMLAEWASTEANDGGIKKAQWINDAFQTQLPNNYPSIKAVVWFNWNADTRNWLIESTSNAQMAFQQSIANSYYASNTFSALSSSPIKPISISTSTPSSTPTSAPLLTPTPISISSSNSITLNPLADVTAYTTDATNQTDANTNYGSDTYMNVDGSPVSISYFKFDLTTLANANITSAKLRLYVGTDGSNGPENVKQVDSNTWTETGLTYNNRPALGSLVSSFTNPSLNTYIESDITSLVNTKKGGQMSLGIDSTNGDGLWFMSKEATNKPQLVITYSTSSGSSTSTPIPTPIVTSTPIVTTAPVSLDNIFPAISINTPNTSVVARNSSQSISVNASDNIGVAKVEIYVNNNLTCTLTTAPYQCNWRVPAKPNQSYTIRATAYDAAGNKSSSEITVTAK